MSNFPVDIKICYGTHRVDVGKISSPFRIRLEPDPKLLIQKPIKIPIRYREILNALLIDLPQNGMVEKFGSRPQEKPV